MNKKQTPQSSIGKWLNDEAHHKDEPTSSKKQDVKAKKTPSKTKKKK